MWIALKPSSLDHLMIGPFGWQTTWLLPLFSVTTWRSVLGISTGKLLPRH